MAIFIKTSLLCLLIIRGRGEIQLSATFSAPEESKSGAVHAEEQLMGTGPLPRDVETEQDIEQALRKALGPRY